MGAVGCRADFEAGCGLLGQSHGWAVLECLSLLTFIHPCAVRLTESFDKSLD